MNLLESITNILKPTVPVPAVEAQPPDPAPGPSNVGGGDGWQYAPDVSDQLRVTVKALADALEFTVSPAPLARLEELGKLYANAASRLRDIGSKRVSLLLSEQSERAVAAAMAGTTSEMKPHEHMSAEQLRHHLSGLKTSVKAGIRAVTAEGQAAAAPIIEDFRAKATVFLDALAASEEEECRQFAVPFNPSGLVVGLRAALSWFCSEALSKSDPRQTLSLLDLLK